VLLLPTWSIVHSGVWKMQVPYLARHCRVITFDGLGNGRSSRPVSRDAYTDREFAADALAVMDATATRQAVLISFSMGSYWALLLAAEHPERVAKAVCIVAVGGSGVGQHLLWRVMAAFPEARQRLPELRMIVVAGPRIDPQSLPTIDGLEVRAYVHALYRHLAVCDLAVVQGGLTTAMELTANKLPFLYFPLRHHFEQNFHVRYRLDRYHAGRCMDFEQATPESIAAAIAEEIGREVVYRNVECDGAARAAARIAELI
jgi:pimeloyl-ACP methyl ester carboxylesterase